MFANGRDKNRKYHFGWMRVRPRTHPLWLIDASRIKRILAILAMALSCRLISRMKWKNENVL